jgi:hypothetical protein
MYKLNDLSDFNDDRLLSQDALPFHLDQDVLYGYDDCDEEQASDVIHIKDVAELVLKKKGSSEEGYSFVLDMGDKKFTFITQQKEEFDQWVKAILSSRAIIKEQ